MKKLLLLAVAGAAYVFGAKAGRQRYEQIKKTFLNVKDSPRVQSAASTVADTAKQQAPVVKDKVSAAATAAVDKVRSSGGSADDDLLARLDPESTARQDNPYPQGDLP